MKAYRINMSSWSASFRYPNLISGYQPSLSAPPLSTIYGLISAAAGYYVSARHLPLGYVFKFSAQTIDLETIYQFAGKSNRLTTKSNVIRRQILFDTSLWLYIDDVRTAECFFNPKFQMLLGRSNDLACVKSVEAIELEPLVQLSRLKGTIVPMQTVPLGAPIQALPVCFTDEIPRCGMMTRPFFLLDYDFKQPEPIDANGYYDSELDFQIYWHDYRASFS